MIKKIGWEVMKDSKSLSKNIFILISLCTFIFLCLAFIFYKISFIDFIKYLAFQVFYIALPGCFIYRKLRLKDETIEKLTISYGFGIVFTLIQYYIFYLINIKMLLFIVGPIISSNELITLFKNKKRKTVTKGTVTKPITTKQIPYSLLSLFTLIFMLMFICFTLYNPLPSVVGRASYYQDLLWYIGNVQSHIRNVVPIDSRLSGVVFKYHYFMTVHVAVMQYVTKIDTTALFFEFSHMGKLTFLFFSIYTLGKYMFRSSKKASAFVFVYFLAGSAGAIMDITQTPGSLLNVNFQDIIFIPSGFALGMGFMCLTVVFLMKQFKQRKINISYLIATSAFLFATTGSKGPLGSMIIAVLLAVMLISIVQGRYNKVLGIYSVILSLIFLVVYNLILSDGAATLGLSFGNIIKGTILAKYITGNLSLAALISVHFLLFLPFASPIFIIWFVQRVRKVKSIDLSQLLIGGLVICGIMATYLLEQDGHSEMYFMMAAIPFIEICALEWIFNNYRKIHIAFKVVLLALLVLSVSTTIFDICKISTITYNKALVILSKTQYEAKSSKNSITKYEYEGMNWIKNNTARSAIIAGDRYYYNEGKVGKEARYFYYSAFSQRQFFLEGWYYHFKLGSPIVDKKLQVMNDFYKGKQSAMDELKRENVSYIVVSRCVHPNLKLTFKSLELKFKNRDIEIYSIS